MKKSEMRLNKFFLCLVADHGYKFHDDLLTANEPAQDVSTWMPLRDETLFARFADIDDKPSDFEDWANIHGELVDPPFDYSQTDSYTFWCQEHRDLSFAVMLWELANNNDSRLNQFIKIGMSGNITAFKIGRKELDDLDSCNFSDCEIVTAYIPQAFKKKDNDIINMDNLIPSYVSDFRGAALVVAWSLAAIKLKAYPLHVVIDLDHIGTSKKYMQPSGLLSAMWYQLYLALTGEIKLRRCAICGKWESMEKHRRNWIKHAKCATYQRIRGYRNKIDRTKKNPNNQ